MRKLICFILFISISATSYSQVDYSIFLQKKISKSDLKKFSNSHKKVKKFNSSECVYGDCKSTKSVIKIEFIIEKFPNGYKIYTYFYVVGSFTNGKLNGRAYIYHYGNELDIDRTLSNKDNVDLILSNDSYTPSNSYIEYIVADFKDNIATKGTYSINIELDNPNKTDELKHALFFDTKDNKYGDSQYSFPLLYRFSQYEYNVNPDIKKITYFYTGDFKTSDFIQYGVDNKAFNQIFIKYSKSKNTTLEYTIKPKSEKGKFDLSYVLYGNKAESSHEFYVNEDNECIGCDVSQYSDFAKDIENSVLAKKQQAIDNIKSWTGKYINGYNNKFYYVDFVDDKGCVYATKIPYENDKYGVKVKLFDKCATERLKLAKQVYDLCPNCYGTGKVSVIEETVHKNTHRTVDDSGVQIVPDLVTYKKTQEFIDITCSVCGGSGVIPNN